MCEISPMWNLGTWLAPARFIIMFSWRAPATHTTHQCFAKWYRAATQFLNILLPSHYILECTSHCCRMHSLHVLYIYIYIYIYISYIRCTFRPALGFVGHAGMRLPLRWSDRIRLGGLWWNQFWIASHIVLLVRMYLYAVLVWNGYVTRTCSLLWSSLWDLAGWCHLVLGVVRVGAQVPCYILFLFPLSRSGASFPRLYFYPPPRFLQRGRRNSTSDFTP